MAERFDVVESAKIALIDELLAAEIYSLAAKISGKSSTRNRLLKISEMERAHAEFWKSFLAKRGDTVLRNQGKQD